jgi:hypothetical protein
MSRRKFYKFLLKFKNFRELWANTGLQIFGGIGFLLGYMTLTYLLAERGAKIPLAILYLGKAFTSWLALGVVMYIIGMFLWAVYSNKKNWEKAK